LPATRLKLSKAERAKIASRISEILRVKYFRTSAFKSLKGGKLKEFGTMLARLDLDSSDFDVKTLGALLKHRQTICVSRPKCKACPLVSFCKFGAERVRQDPRPVAVDLFGGAGGMGNGFRKAGFRIALAVEYDRDAAQTYRLNNPGVVVKEWNVATLTARRIRKEIGSSPAVICAGPPCQSYSAAGLRKSRDPRHHLFRHVLEIARQLKPQFVVIENVPGINRSVGSRNFGRIIEVELLKDFAAEVFMLRAIDFGVPQVRKRYFFVGRQRGIPPINRPTPTHKGCGEEGARPVTPTVLQVLRQIPRSQHGRYQDWSLFKGSIIWNLGTMLHSPRVIRKIRRIRGGEGPLSYRRLSRNYATTIIAGHRALPVHPTLHRTISVKEAALIQGFDLHYTFLGARANQPLQVANAVPPPVAYAMGNRIKQLL
jgi:DNA (cytosine-5)-methyltransferase 1